MSAGTESPSSPRFSIVMIVRNEERTIARTFYLLEDFIDRGGEVVVVDTGSTDGTDMIAKRRGCRVEAVGDRFDLILTEEHVATIQQHFAKDDEGPLVEAGQRVFNFGAARQYAASLATNDFVFELDASDEISALDIDWLDDQIASGQVGSFQYDQIYGAMSLRIARFYDRRLFHWEGRTHEVLVPNEGADLASAPRIQCSAKQLVVHHQEQRKERNYLAGLALQVIEAPEKPRWWHFLGRELFYDRWFRSAIPVLEAHAKMDTAWNAERSQSWCFIGESLKALRRSDEAEEAYRRSIEVDPTRREPHLELASVYSRRGDFANAVRCAKAALAIPRTNAYPELAANYTWRPHSILYWNLFWMGRRDEAREHWEQFIALVPEENIPKEHLRFFPPIGKNDKSNSPQVSKSTTAAK